MQSQHTRQSRTSLLIVVILSLLFAVIFSYLSIRRIHVLWASYFDLGIMHQTVYNTYMSIKQLDPTRFLELTDPHGSGRQINRMAIHADVFLALLTPLYFIHSGPEMLLILQAFFVASGGIALYLIAKHCVEKVQRSSPQAATYVPIAVSLLYFLYAPLHRALLYEFHAVTLSTSLALWLYLAYLYRRWTAVALLSILLLTTKEQIGFGLGIFFFIEAIRSAPMIKDIFVRPQMVTTNIVQSNKARILLLCAVGCVVYTLLTVFVVMPLFRMGDDHFALHYFTQQQKSSTNNPLLSLLSQITNKGSFTYLFTLVGPLAFTPIGSLMVLPALPDFLINTLSSSANMRNIYFHYTSFITPWLFIGMVDVLTRMAKWKKKKFLFLLTVVLTCGLIFSYESSPLPYSKSNQNSLWTGNHAEQQDILLWQQILASDDIRVAATGQFAPYLTSRRYYYDFGKNYTKADYVVLMVNTKSKKVETYGDAKEIENAYANLLANSQYKKVYARDSVEVYKKIQ